MLLTTDDLVGRFRSEVDDLIRGAVTDPNAANDALWTTDDVMSYMNEAVAQVASDTLSLYKTFNVPFIAANGPYVKMPGGYTLLDINVIYLVTARRVIKEHNAVDGTRHHNDYGFYGGGEGWEVATAASPTRFTRDFRPGYLRLYPAPTNDDTLQITACIGSMDLQCGMPLPFTDPKDIRLVLAWMKFLAYQKQDADTFDPNKSMNHAAWYEEHAKQRKYECQRLRRAPSAVKFSW